LLVVAHVGQLGSAKAGAFPSLLVRPRLVDAARSVAGEPLGATAQLRGAARRRRRVPARMLALHLLQSALVHVNTLLMQIVLSEPGWAAMMTDEDRRALTPLFWTHINPYGKFDLDMSTRLDFGPLLTG
jgi:hypothetical protein